MVQAIRPTQAGNHHGAGRTSSCQSLLDTPRLTSPRCARQAPQSPELPELRRFLASQSPLQQVRSAADRCVSERGTTCSPGTTVPALGRSSRAGGTDRRIVSGRRRWLGWGATMPGMADGSGDLVDPCTRSARPRPGLARVTMVRACPGARCRRSISRQFEAGGVVVGSAGHRRSVSVASPASGLRRPGRQGRRLMDRDRRGRPNRRGTSPSAVPGMGSQPALPALGLRRQVRHGRRRVRRRARTRFRPASGP